MAFIRGNLSKSVMDHMRDHVKAKNNSQSGFDKLTRDELIELVIKAKTDEKAMEQVLFAMYPYMHQIASKVRLPNTQAAVSGEDMFQTAIFGLMKAVEKYDPEYLNDSGQPMSFTTYATHWLKQVVGREASQNCETIRLPVHAYQILRSLSTKYAKWCVDNEQVEKPISNVDPQFLLDTFLKDHPTCTINTVKMIQDWMINSKTYASLDDTMSFDDGDGETILDFMSDGQTLESEMFSIFNDETTLKKVYNLPQRKRYVIMARFGIGPFHEMTLEEVGDVLSLTRERVRQIESMSLRMLKTAFRKEGGREVFTNAHSRSSNADILDSDILKKLTPEQVSFLLNDNELESLKKTVDGFEAY